jgi:hypothetical protein
MPKQEKIPQSSPNALTETYLKKLSPRELTELFTSISHQFTSRLNDCKEIDELESLQNYLHMINAEIAEREKDV